MLEHHGVIASKLGQVGMGDIDVATLQDWQNDLPDVIEDFGVDISTVSLVFVIDF